MSLANASDQRRYFRVQDTVAIYARKIDSGATADATPLALQSSKRLLHQLHAIDIEHLGALRAVSDKSRELAECLHAIQQKIDVLAQTVILTQGASYYRTENVILSGSGLGFSSSEASALGDVWDIHLILLSSALAVSFTAQVVWSRTSGQQHFLGADILEITDPDRDAIIRHTLHVQASHRRHSKEAPTP